MTKKLIGSIGVDSGQIMVGDPCYLSTWMGVDGSLGTGWYEKALEMSKDDDFAYSYEGACMASCCKDGAAVIGRCTAVSMRTKYGDGRYPVYLVTNDRGRHALVVEMGDEEFEDHHGHVLPGAMQVADEEEDEDAR